MIELTQILKKTYPDLKFVSGKRFSFQPPNKILVGPDEPDSDLLLLHEVGHALCGHRDFSTDAMRLKMEREAWEKAREISKELGVVFNDDVVERELDTYRDWLDSRSRCKTCGLSRYQTPDGVYHCPRCENFI